MTLYLGLMSGTSMDGIDAALVDVSTHKMLQGMTQPYSGTVINLLNNLCSQSQVSLAAVCQLHILIGQEFARVANDLLQQAKVETHQICAIGSHGQTVCHNTQSFPPYTLQLGCGHTISSLTGITVVADFRSRDMVNGGQGAPLAPLYHQELLKNNNLNTALVNVGGIANITFISAKEATVGWDVGPGNCLLDAWISKHLDKAYDAQGAWASQGEVINPLLSQLLADPQIRRLPPKSMGKEYFSLDWLKGYLKPEYKPANVQKTLLAFTAQNIVDTLTQVKKPINSLFICGGGAHNLALMRMLTELFPEIKVATTAEIGVDPDYVEAMLCAWLAAQTINHQAVDLRLITGSQRPMVLGVIYPSS